MLNISSVITADIVNSEPSWAKELGKRLELTIHSNQPAAKVFFYRGDSFQAYLPDPISAYRIALKLRTQAILFEQDRPEVKTDVRMSVGIGTVDLPITQLATAQGEAFLISGRSFDEVVKNEKRLHLQCMDEKINLTLNSISLFTDYLFQSMTMKQAEVLQYLLDHRTQVETAKSLKRSQSTVNRHVQSMGWKQIEELIDLYQQSILLISTNHGE